MEEGATGSVQGSLQDLWTGHRTCSWWETQSHVTAPHLLLRDTCQVVQEACQRWHETARQSHCCLAEQTFFLPIACACSLNNMVSQSSNFRSCSQSVTRVLFQDGLWLPHIFKATVSLWQEAWLSFQKVTDAEEHRQGWASLLNPRREHWSLTCCN